MLMWIMTQDVPNDNSKIMMINQTRKKKHIYIGCTLLITHQQATTGIIIDQNQIHQILPAFRLIFFQPQGHLRKKELQSVTSAS
jgi:hypothetical protein